MKKTLYLSRALLRHDADTPALRDALSRLDSVRAAAAHRLIWTLFGDVPDRRRDFLWREGEPGTFYLLSARPPVPNDLFHLHEPKPFDPVIASGDRLQFTLRVNATVARKPPAASPGSGVRGERSDIVMDAIHAVSKEHRARHREAVLADVAANWLSGQGRKHGFSLASAEASEPWEVDEPPHTPRAALTVAGYRVLRVGRSRGRKPLQFGVLDTSGTLVVDDPVRFIASLGEGFGRGKAFGCGLMLIRRAR